MYVLVVETEETHVLCCLLDDLIRLRAQIHGYTSGSVCECIYYGIASVHTHPVYKQHNMHTHMLVDHCITVSCQLVDVCVHHTCIIHLCYIVVPNNCNFQWYPPLLN